MVVESSAIKHSGKIAITLVRLPRSGEEEKLFTLLYFVITSKVVLHRVATVELKRGDNILSLFRRVKRAYSARRSKDSGLEHI